MKKSQTFLMKWIKMTRNTFYNSGAFDPGKRNVCLTCRQGGKNEIKTFPFQFYIFRPSNVLHSHQSGFYSNRLVYRSPIVIQLYLLLFVCVWWREQYAILLYHPKLDIFFPPKNLAREISITADYESTIPNILHSYAIVVFTVKCVALSNFLFLVFSFSFFCLSLVCKPQNWSGQKEVEWFPEATLFFCEGKGRKIINIIIIV